MNLKNKKILITCGPTWVPIDDMRVIANRSTGEMGQLLAKTMLRTKASVTLLEGPVQKEIVLKATYKKLKFLFYKDFARLMKQEVPKHNIIIHAAAVSDYQCVTPNKTKISSHKNELTLKLKPTPKIITHIKKWNPACILVGFKLESNMNKKVSIISTQSLFQESNCDFVIANSNKNKVYKAFLIDKNTKYLATTNNKLTIAAALLSALKEM